MLIVDDEPDMVDSCARILRRAGYRCLTASDPQRAAGLLESERPDLLLTDLKMPGMDGLALLRRAKELDPALPVVVITAFATIESAVSAIKDGAFDYLPKTFSVDQLTLVVERALRQRRLALENLHLREQLKTTFALDNVLGRSPAMAQVFELVKKAARSEANILVLAPDHRLRNDLRSLLTDAGYVLPEGVDGASRAGRIDRCPRARARLPANTDLRRRSAAKRRRTAHSWIHRIQRSSSFRNT